MKKLIFRCLLFVFIAVLSAAALELAIRIFLPMYNPSGMLEFRRNTDGITLGIKNFSGHQWTNTGDYNVSVEINRCGFRDAKDLRNSKETDVFVVGDSFGFGHGVEEEKRYSNVLQGMMDKSVYNISINGADMDSYEDLIEYAKRNGATIKNIIIGVSMENDLRNYDIPNIGNRTHRAPLSGRWNKTDFTVVKEWLAKHTALYHVFARICYVNENLKGAAVKAGLIDELIDGHYYGNMPAKAYSEEVISSSTGRLCRLAGPFNETILIIPSRGLWVGKNRAAEQKIHEKFATSVKESGLNAIDLRPIFEESGDPMQYHFKHDGHWNEKGHLKAAEILKKGSYLF